MATSTSTPVLELQHVDKVFPGVKALIDVSLSVQKGEIRGLIGPNGSGKSTMIATIMGNYRPDGGKVLFEGKALAGVKVWDRVRMGINWTNQTATYVPDLTIRRHIELGVDVNDHPKEDVERVAAIVDLEDALDELPTALSAVGAKKLELGKVLTTRPSFLMLDECFAGLSFEEGMEMVGIIKTIVADHEITVLVVDHNLGLVEEVAQITTVIDRGSVIAEGPFQEIVNNPVVVDAYMG
jgi:ABC-type branched-subunit amino acid transport system ATPase component